MLVGGLLVVECLLVGCWCGVGGVLVWCWWGVGLVLVGCWCGVDAVTFVGAVWCILGSIIPHHTTPH